MKNFFLFTIIISSFVSCNKILKENETSKTIKKEYQIGGQRDEHGCVQSAGYTWSILKNDCIRVFEVGYRLNPVNHNSDEVVINAFILFDEAKGKVELFLPNNSKSIILTKDENSNYIYKNYIFNSKDFYLTIDNIKVYEAASENLKNIDDFQEEIEE